jgi:hypothetical protein
MTEGGRMPMKVADTKVRTGIAISPAATLASQNGVTGISLRVSR